MTRLDPERCDVSICDGSIYKPEKGDQLCGGADIGPPHPSPKIQSSQFSAGSQVIWSNMLYFTW
jgi:hypothetical protein